VAHTADPDDAVQWAGEGFQLVNVTSDTHLVQQGAMETLKILTKGRSGRQGLDHFDRRLRASL